MNARKPVYEDEPQVGYYWRRYVRGGPKVPAMIWDASPRDEDTGDLIGDEVFGCIIDGRPVDVFKEWTWIAGHPITKSEYDALVASRSKAPDILADHAVDLTAMEPIGPGS